MYKNIKKQCKKTMFLFLTVFYLPCFAENAVRNVECVSVKVMLLFFTKTRYLATLRRAKWSVPITYYDNHVASYHLLISLSDSNVKNATKR